MVKHTFTAVINKRRERYYAFCAEVPADAWGESSSEAMALLQAETQLYVEEVPVPDFGKPITKPLAVTVHDSDDKTRDYSFTAVIHREGDQYVADCPEVGSSSFSDSIEKALARLREATELQLQDAPLPGYSQPIIVKFEVAVGEVAHAA